MGQFWDEILSSLIPWITEQHLFWVASAPLSKEGHVNVSPKGLQGTFHVIDRRTVWYEDMTGSGVETISHVRENGRITVLFSAFEGPPRIVRLFGTGTIYEFGTPEYEELLPPEKRNHGSRAIVMINVHKVGSSCGYSVPFFEFKSHRTRYYNVARKFEAADVAFESECPDEQLDPPENGLRGYWKKVNAKSLDGLPALLSAPLTRLGKRDDLEPEKATTYDGKRSGTEGELTATKGRAVGLLDPKFVAGMSVGFALAFICLRMT